MHHLIIFLGAYLLLLGAHGRHSWCLTLCHFYDSFPMPSPTDLPLVHVILPVSGNRHWVYGWKQKRQRFGGGYGILRFFWSHEGAWIFSRWKTPISGNLKTPNNFCASSFQHGNSTNKNDTFCSDTLKNIVAETMDPQLVLTGFQPSTVCMIWRKLRTVPSQSLT